MKTREALGLIASVIFPIVVLTMFYFADDAWNKMLAAEMLEFAQQKEQADSPEARAKVSSVIRSNLHSKYTLDALYDLYRCTEKKELVPLKEDMADVILFKKFYGGNAPYDELLFRKMNKNTALNADVLPEK